VCKLLGDFPLDAADDAASQAHLDAAGVALPRAQNFLHESLGVILRAVVILLNHPDEIPRFYLAPLRRFGIVG